MIRLTLFKRDLKVFIFLALTILSGNLFHNAMGLYVRKCCVDIKQQAGREVLKALPLTISEDALTKKSLTLRFKIY